MSEKRVARECFAAVTKDGDSSDLYTFDDEESANAFAYTYSGRHFKMREVIEPDERDLLKRISETTLPNISREELEKSLMLAYDVSNQDVEHIEECRAEIVKLKEEVNDLRKDQRIKFDLIMMHGQKNCVLQRENEKLRETLNVAKECLAHLSNLDTINQGNPMEGVAFKSLARIRAIFGEKEGADENG